MGTLLYLVVEAHSFFFCFLLTFRLWGVVSVAMQTRIVNVSLHMIYYPLRCGGYY